MPVAEPMVAADVLLQVPPVTELVSVTEAPMQVIVGPPIAAGAVSTATV
jgi:hypothetical protein